MASIAAPPRIFITGDVMRPSIDGQGDMHQGTNIMWTYNMLKPILESVTDAVVEPLVTPLGYKRTQEDWLAQWDVKCPSWQLVVTNPEDVIVGFEMPPNYVHQAKQQGRRFVNLVIHPARYLDDLIWGVSTTNLTTMGGNISQYALQIGAGQVISKVRNYLPQLGWSDNAMVIVGQTDMDSSVICEGRPLTLDLFEDRLAAMVAEHSEAYFKPHPVQPITEENVLTLMLARLGVRITDENGYRILCEKGLKTVCGISSSLLCEARYFGKEAIFFANEHRLDEYAPTSHGQLMSRNFWAQALPPSMLARRPGLPEWIIETPNKLRKSCGGWWAYDLVDKLGVMP